MAKLKTNDWGAMSHTMASHRAQRLLEILPNAMSHGFAEIDPEFEHLKNFDHDTVIPSQDNNVTFVFGQDSIDSRNRVLQRLFGLWEGFSLRSSRLEAEWIQHLSGYLSGLADDRIQHVRDWIDANTERFKDGQQHAAIDEVYRHFESLAMELKVNVDLCKLQCEMCSLKCLKHRSHEVSDSHDCGTSHFCQHWCEFEEEHVDGAVRCGYPAGHAGKHTCEVNRHMCGEPCGLSSRKGCLIHCTNVANHPADEGHFCSARIHSCGEPCTLVNVLGTGDQRFTCRGSCILPSDQQHDQHQCELPGCPMRCVLCSRLCDSTDHLHALDDGAVHLCGQTHSCPSLCAARGICEIDTAPQSIEATFTGRNETFQYTKRSKCAILIPEGETSHAGAHSHSLEADPFHFCETQCSYCNYYCTLPLGHTQREHDTRHGSMSRTVWSVEGPDTNVMEVDGRKFSGQDDGAPMLCSLVCSSLGRHIHIDVCQSENTTACGDADVRHIAARMLPDPDIAKDFITHALYWRRCGFKDPYSKDEQTTWAKCDCYCPGTEHEGNENDPPQHSYCTLPMFHPPAQDSQAPPMGYVSRDGHAFACKNPTVMQLAFHVSGSMADRDRRPLQGTPVTAEITRVADNRLGAVYSSLFAFWSSRSAAINASGAPAQARRDAYSVVFFDSGVSRSITNDFTSTPEELLQSLLQYTPRGWTNYNLAIQETTRVVRENWSTERSPVVVFLSDGECDVDDQHVVEAWTKPLSFHTVAFGPSNAVLRRMAQLALDVQNSAPPDQTLQGGQNIPSSYTEALDSICLAQTFLGFAESLRKARGALVVH
ncbi:hypothetical protein DL96DRAFT_1668099 [Flagelloscypha sp. PMI_526]|nr:hypothetical protein DL96DRAFT_1668099 [Flagelloscypha sp. PMI_526]